MSSPSLYRNLLIPQFGPSHLAMKHAGEAFDFFLIRRTTEAASYGCFTVSKIFRKFTINIKVHVFHSEVLGIRPAVKRKTEFGQGCFSGNFPNLMENIFLRTIIFEQSFETAKAC